MTAFALTLVLLAACIHALWNLAAKRAGGGLPFVFLTSVIINALYLPVVVCYVLWKHPSLPWGACGMIAVSGCLKTAYSLFLQRSYRSGDFSLVYPLARGTGPLLATLVAVLFLGERPTPVALAGGAAIIAAVFVLTGGHRLLHADRAHLRRGAAYGLATGVTIATYTLWDRHGVAAWKIPPLIYDAGTAVTVLALTTPLAWRRRDEVAREWREHRFEAIIVALLSPAGYLLILWALSFTPVSYVAPAREVSIVIGTFLGARLFKETAGARRVWAAVAMVAGIVALAMG